MFKNYEIKYINNEEVLFLYLDLNTEFAKIKNTSKAEINSEIKKYASKKNINFRGKKVVLMLGSLMLSSILLTTPLLDIHESVNSSINYSTNILSITDDISDNNINIPSIEITEEKADNKEQTNINETSQKENTNKETNTSNNNQNNNTNNKPNSNTPAGNASKPNNNTPSKNETGNQNTIAKQMVTIKRSNGTILVIELEEYLIGVVGAEMPASFHSEALKAQAIAARTYAMKALEENKTLTDNVSTQAYKDNDQLKSQWGSSYNTYYNKIKNAVDSTKGLVITYNGTLINAFYHSTSNGYTEDASVVFREFPYLKSVESPVDLNVSSYLRTISLTYEQISNKLNIPVTSLSTIKIEKNDSNRVSKIIIDNQIYGGIEFRTKLGLRSTDFDILLNENNITITTRGYGHGVGMSQYGANEYAKNGMSYQNILEHYYTGIKISKY